MELSDTSPRTQHRTAWIAAGLVALVIGVFGQVANHELIDADDYTFIAGRVDPAGTASKPNIRDGLTWANVVDAFQSYYFFMPLPTISIELNHSLTGDSAAGFLLGNVLIHTLSTLALFGLLRSATGDVICSAFAAAIFAIHPLNVEPVAWASCRKDSLAALFSILTLWSYTRWSQRPSGLRATYVAVALVGGMLSKSGAVMIPVLLVLLDFWPLGRMECGSRGLPSLRSVVRSVASKAHLFAIAAVMAFVTINQYGAAGNIHATDSVPLDLRVLGAIDAYGWYLAKAFWPSGLTIYHPHIGGSFFPTQAPPIWRVAASAAALLSISGYAIAHARTRPYLLVGWLWFLIVMLPTAGLVQIYTGATASRYMYVPGIGLVIAVVWEVGAWARERARDTVRLGRATAALGCVALAILATVSWRQVGTWKDSRTVFTRAIAVTDDNWFAQSALAQVVLTTSGPDAAKPHYREVFRIRPDWARPRFTFASALHGIGNPNRSIPHWEAGLAADPDDARARGLYGLDLLEVGRTEEAEINLRFALTQFPRSKELRDALVETERRLTTGNPSSAAPAP